MANNKMKTTPLSFEIDSHLAESLEKLQKQLGNVSVSKLIDQAVARFDYRSLSRQAGGERRQLSVRLSDDKRSVLDKHAKSEKVSMAFLIRKALEEMLESAKKKTVQADLRKALEAARPVKKAAPVKAVKKAAGKKAIKKAAKKAAGKKSAGKKVTAKKATTKKGPAKKAVKKAVKKAAVKKAAAKKAPAKKAAVKKAAVKKGAVKKGSKKKVPARKRGR